MFQKDLLKGKRILVTGGGSGLGKAMATRYFSAGLGIPFLLAAAGIGYFLKFLVRIRSYIRPIEIFTGLLLILFGVLILTNRMQEIAFFFIEYFPILNSLG